jgi:hemerythrin-like metal-binding protein/PAS domain S-box-containing protein
MNPVAEHLTGWDEQHAKGKALLSVFNIVNVKTRELVENPVDRVLLEGEIVGLANHTVLISKNGDEYQIADSAAPIKDANGVIFGAILVFRDVTEEYRIQQALADKEIFQEQMLNGMLTFLAILNADGEVLFVNKSGLAIGGDAADMERMRGKKLYDIGCWNYSERDRLIIKDDLEKSRITNIRARDIQIQSGDGSLIWIEFHINKINDDQGQLQYLIAEGRDITERKNAEEQLRRGQKMEALGKLTGGIAHDYNNMLGVIMGYAEMLASNLEQQPELAKYATEIYRSGERGARLAKKLLGFSRNRQAETEIVNLNDVLNDELHMLEKTMTPKISLRLELQNDLWLTEIDKGDLEDAILNVCINAMQAMPDSGDLTLTTKNLSLRGLDAEILDLEPGDYVELSITDTGIGMDKTIQARIFDPFFTTKEDGTGLGLSQVYGFVKSTGGTVKVYSELGKGSRLIFLLPRKESILDNKPELKKVELEDVAGGSESILVVDDEAGLRNLAQNVLTRKGYKVFVAENADEALKVLEKQEVDLLLSDVIMPGIDGYMLANLVQQRFPEIKIQMVSGFSDDRHLKVIDENLHQQLLKKPYKSVDLLNRIRLLLDNESFTAEKTNNAVATSARTDADLKDLLIWNDEMKIGLPQIDRQHKKLHELLLRCLNIVNINKNHTSIKMLLDELLEYTQYHFRDEEVIMETCGYPFLENHHEVHKMLVNQVKKQIKQFEQGDFSAQSLLLLLKEWFIEHNMGMDRAIVEYAKGKEAIIDKALNDSNNPLKDDG